MGQVNIRVADGRVEAVRQRLKEVASQMGISQGDVLEKGLEKLGEGASASEGGIAQKTYERAGRIENMVEELLGLGVSVQPRVDAGGSSTPLLDMVRGRVDVPADNRPKNARCKHCGEMFAGARFATICPGCKSIGHTLMPADCPVCGEGLSI